jgi:hypothetical protein
MTLAAPKTALAEAAQTVGRLFLADISVPALVYQRLGFAYKTPFSRRPVIELRTAHIRDRGVLCTRSQAVDADIDHGTT